MRISLKYLVFLCIGLVCLKFTDFSMTDKRYINASATPAILPTCAALLKQPAGCVAVTLIS